MGSTPPVKAPEGLRYIPDVLTAVEERTLIEQIRTLTFSEVRMHGVVASAVSLISDGCTDMRRGGLLPVLQFLVFCFHGGIGRQGWFTRTRKNLLKSL